MSGFMEMMLKNSRPNRAFFSPEVTILNFKGKSVFFLSSSRLSSFYCHPFLFLCLLHGLKAACRSCKIKE